MAAVALGILSAPPLGLKDTSPSGPRNQESSMDEQAQTIQNHPNAMYQNLRSTTKKYMLI